jgi:hypothetical protein
MEYKLELPKGMNEHYGEAVYTIPEILKTGEAPISLEGLMQARITFWRYHDLHSRLLDTSDLMIYPKGDNENIYVLLTVNNQNRITENGREALTLFKPENINVTEDYSDGIIVKQLDKLNGNGFIRIPRKGMIINKLYSGKKALKEQIWRVLMRHPDEVPAEFAEERDSLKNLAYGGT